jgi:hypothetical protein
MPASVMVLCLINREGNEGGGGDPERIVLPPASVCPTGTQARAAHAAP